MLFEATKRLTWAGASLCDALAFLLADDEWGVGESRSARSLIYLRDERRRKVAAGENPAPDRYRPSDADAFLSGAA